MVPASTCDAFHEKLDTDASGRSAYTCVSANGDHSTLRSPRATGTQRRSGAWRNAPGGDLPVSAQPTLGALDRLAALRARIERRARDCGRDPSSVRLFVVSNSFSGDEVWPTIADGRQLLFGENRVQEAKAKWPILRARAAALGKTIELH